MCQTKLKKLVSDDKVVCPSACVRAVRGEDHKKISVGGKKNKKKFKGEEE